jgi:hypothetical protein
MRLPVELRAMIFTYALQGHTWTYHPPYIFPGHHSIALLFTCRQIYAETATLLFAINTLNLGWIETNNYVRDYFLAQRTDAQLGAARSVHLRSSAYSPTGPKLIHRALNQLPGLRTVYLTYGAHKFVLTAEDGRVWSRRWKYWDRMSLEISIGCRCVGLRLETRCECKVQGAGCSAGVGR